MDGRRALVIDDEVHSWYFLRVLLEKAGFAVKMACNGIEAPGVLRSWRPDVITLDVMMPEQSSLTSYRAACRDEDWKRIPAVMPSVVSILAREHAFAMIGLTQGPFPVLVARLEKPCMPEALLEAVNRLVPEPTTV